MERKNGVKIKQIAVGVGIAFMLGLVFLLVFKAQLETSEADRVDCTLMWEHKENNIIELSAEKNSLTEIFTCKVPELKIITIECKGKQVQSDAKLILSLIEPDTGKNLFFKEYQLKSVVNSEKNFINIKLKKAISNSEDKQFALSMELVDAGKSQILITSNCKAGLVTSFDGVKENKTNIIYSVQYASVKQIKNLYVPLCILLLILGVLAYYLIIIRKATVDKFYIPIAILLGITFQFVIVTHGVPDEPWHIDTAYKLSNQLLFVNDSDEPGTLLKRQCDIEMGDMLANGVESNSYYQLMNHTFEMPENTELVRTTYIDSSNLVPDVIFLPTALGISLGRLLGLSAMLTLQLGRMINLLVFIIMTWFAIRKIPYGKNIMGALGMMPITLQQAASASYDPMINGIVFLFIATCFCMKENRCQSKKDWILLVILLVLIALVKGGVYLPVLLLLCILINKREVKNGMKRVKKRWIVSGVCGSAILLVIAIQKIRPIIDMVMVNDVNSADSDALYTVPYLLAHPLNVIYLFWNTVMKSGEKYVAGMFGGMLGWHNVKISWFFMLPIIIGVLLLVNVEDDKYIGSIKQKICMSVICVLSCGIIMASMLLACTTIDKTNIVGIQGRYFLPLAPLLLFVSSNSMVKVSKEQCNKIWLMLILIEIMVLLQFVVAVV